MATDLASSFPQLTWRDQSLITVDAGDSSAIITAMTIHLAQDTPDELLELPDLLPVFVPGGAA